MRVVLLLQGRVEYLLLHYASRALYRHFLDAGIEIFEYHRSFLHAKVAVIDDRWATVGSSNIDPMSLLLAREANVLIDDAGFARELRASLSEAIETRRAAGAAPRSWERQSHSLSMRVMTWICYGLVRFLSGWSSYGQARDFRRRIRACRGQAAGGARSIAAASRVMFQVWLKYFSKWRASSCRRGSRRALPPCFAAWHARAIRRTTRCCTARSIC